jgi:hypothetical protein
MSGPVIDAVDPRFEHPHTPVVEWLLESQEPWTRYRTLVDLLDRPEDDPLVLKARAEMLAHPQVRELVACLSTWGDRPLKRHNDASHPIYKLSTLADFGLGSGDTPPGSDVGMPDIVQAVMDHQAPEGAFQTVVNIPERFGGTGQDAWSWMACDAPTLLYSLLAMGLGNDPCLCPAVEHLVSLVHGNGWRCAASPDLGRFRGPGRKDDPCPIASVYALRALGQVPDLVDSHIARTGVEMLLGHWERQGERKLYLFGIGTDFRKLKYPYVWYNLLHVVEALSHFPFVHTDWRFLEMVRAITDQADQQGRHTASSMYRAWKGWSFADKKNPSPWLTFLVLRILKRMQQ